MDYKNDFYKALPSSMVGRVTIEKINKEMYHVVYRHGYIARVNSMENAIKYINISDDDSNQELISKDMIMFELRTDRFVFKENDSLSFTLNKKTFDVKKDNNGRLDTIESGVESPIIKVSPINTESVYVRVLGYSPAWFPNLREAIQFALDENIKSKELPEDKVAMASIPKELYDRLDELGIIPSEVNKKNVGASNYSKNIVQPWVIFNAYPELNYQECDIIKRVLRTKDGEERLLDLEKIKHITTELIRQETYK